MKIESGKCYRLRNGKKAFVSIVENLIYGMVEGEFSKNSWFLNGMASSKLVENEWDIVAEWSEWKPIETAPKDGRIYLVCLPRQMNLIIRARYNTVHNHWLTDLKSQGVDKVHFFHEGDLYQELPTPPEEAER